MNAPVAAPQWADSSRGLGRWIERLIAVGLFRRPLFFQARQLIIRTAERNGIPWRQRRAELQQAAAPLLAESTTAGLKTPDYYRVRFHAYEEGNLCWQAAAEAEQATDAMALRVWPDDVMSPEQAQQRLRDAFIRVSNRCWISPLSRFSISAVPSGSAPRRSPAGWPGDRRPQPTPHRQ